MFGKNIGLDEEICKIIKENSYYVPECGRIVAIEKGITQLEAEEIVKQHIHAMRRKYGSRLNISDEKKLHKERTAKVVSCPKCGSTSITTSNKKLSVKRGVAGAIIGTAVPGVGNAIGAAAGAVAGGLSSKKIYNVCMNCGHKWKP